MYELIATNQFDVQSIMLTSDRWGDVITLARLAMDWGFASLEIRDANSGKVLWSYSHPSPD